MTTDWVDEIKAKISMPDLVGLTVKLKKTGHCYSGLCPFHPDRNTPSLKVFSDHAHCFGCSGHWDIISWTEQRLGLGFSDAVKWLQDRAGIIPKSNTLPHSSQYVPTTPIPLLVLEYWHSLATPDVRQYYYGRCLTDETIDLFMLGHDGTNYVIPIWEGEPRESLVYGVKFRCPEGVSPKYFGLRGRSQPKLFNKFVLKDAKEVVIVLGEFDAILAYQMGLATVSPTSGQNVWLVEWTRLFNDVGTIFVLPDRGERAAGYQLQSLFGSRGHLCEFPVEVKDLTEFFQKEYTIKYLRDVILSKDEYEIDLSVKPFWEENK